MLPPVFPTPEELAPALDKLERNAGSMVLVVLEQPGEYSRSNWCQTTWAWFSKEDRKALRNAVDKCRSKAKAKT